jgi:hypothetical protein
MKNKKNVNYLIENGLSEKTVANLSESQIKLLVEKFKKENKEQVQQQQTTKTIVGPKGGNIPLKPGQTTVSLKPVPNAQPGTVEVVEKEMTEDETDDVTSGNALGKDAEQSYTGQEAPHDANDMADDGMDDDSSDDRSMMGMAESTLNEKFESKAQQGLFWARCNKCSSKNCKWCKMAKEFSDSTSKKQYKTMPEKKHPEKTVKVKEKTNEGLEKFLEKKIIDIVESSINPKMTKKDLIEAIKKKSKKTPKSDSMIIRKPKKLTMFSDEAPMELPIGKMFSIGKK